MASYKDYLLMYDVLQKMEDDIYYEATHREQEAIYSVMYGAERKTPKLKNIDSYGNSLNTHSHHR